MREPGIVRDEALQLGVDLRDLAFDLLQTRAELGQDNLVCLLYTSPSPRD